MIARKWVGVVSRADANSYGQFLTGKHGIGEYRSLPGNRGGLLLRRDTGNTSEFELISIWDDLAALKGYAGDEYERPRYYPKDLAVLISPADFVEHPLVVGCNFPEIAWP